VFQTLGPILQVSREEAEAAQLPHWKHIAQEPENEIARLDPAFVQFVTNMGFPGSERLNPRGCLRKVREMAHRVEEYTEQRRWTFRQNPERFENSEAMFRALCLTTVLQREFDVRYDLAKAPRDVPFEVEDTTIHGIIFGNGGTCVSLPVLYAAVGRILRYPIKLVHSWVNQSTGHQFARWDGGGARFNIECTGTGLCTPPDDHYRAGVYEMTPEIERQGQFLISLTPRQELAGHLRERGRRWRDLGNWQYACEALAWALSLDPTNVAHKDGLHIVLNHWKDLTNAQKPPQFPKLFIGLPHGVRFMPASLPLKYEQDIFGQMSVEHLLTYPQWAPMWEKMRRGQWHGPGPTRATVDYRTDGTRQITLE
jgi:hypothetical protein